MPTKRPSAFNKALQESPQQDNKVVTQQNSIASKTVVQQDSVDSKTVAQQDNEVVKATAQQSNKTTKKQNKVMLYLTDEQVNRVEDYAYKHRKRTGKRTNLNDIVRHLIDSSSDHSFDDL